MHSEAAVYTRWFKYDQDDLCVNKSQFVPVIFEPPCIKQKGKAIPVQTYTCPEGPRKLRILKPSVNGGGKVVSPAHRPSLFSTQIPGTHL